MNMKKVLIVFTVVFLTLISVSAEEKEIVGSWQLEAEEAPYEFQVGSALFYKSEQKLMLKLVFEYNEIDNIEVSQKDNTYQFNVEIEYQNIPVKLKLANGVITGVAETPDGDFTIVMKDDK